MQLNQPLKLTSTVRKDEQATLKWWHAHVILGTLALVIAVVILLLTGAFVKHALGAQYFEQRYPAPQTVPVKATGPIYFPSVSLPPSGSIDMKYLPSVGNQFSLGSCQCWGSNYYIATYVYRKATGTWIRLSPRWCYDYVSHGQDGGSFFQQDITLPYFVRFNAYPYTFNPNTYVITNPPPTNLPKIKVSFQIHWLSQGQSGGRGAVDAVRNTLATLKTPINLDFPVWSEFDGAATTSGFVLPPTEQEVQQQPYGRGGHAITIIGYNDTLKYGGHTGFFRIVNQWSSQWGDGGFAWMSYDLVAKYGWNIGYVTYGGRTSTAPRVKTPPPFFPRTSRTVGSVLPRKFYRPSDYTHNPKDNSIPVSTLPRASAWWVKGVYATNGTDLSPIVNKYGNQYHLWPVGIAATIANESGFNIYAERWGVSPDISFGLMQQTVQTANYYCVSGDTETVRVWEEIPTNSIYCGSKILAAYRAYRGWDFPSLYCLYNAGAGTSDINGPCALAYNDYLENYYYAIAHFQCYSNCPGVYNPIKPPTFNAVTWWKYEKEHHLKFTPYLNKFQHFTTIANVWLYHQGWGGYVKQHWNNRHKVMVTQFQNEKLYTWPQYRNTWKAVKTGYWK